MYQFCPVALNFNVSMSQARDFRTDVTKAEQEKDDLIKVGYSFG